MSLLLLDRRHARVEVESETLVVRGDADSRRVLPIALIERCIIHGADTQISSGALLKLAEAGIPVVLMSPRIKQRVAFMHGPLHQEAAVRLAQYRRIGDIDHCRRWSSSIVTQKLQRQWRTLSLWLQARPDARKPLTDAMAVIANALQTLATGRELDLPALRGIEGSAAREYFGGFAAVLPASLGFAGRNRRPPRDPVNVCLSLSYSLLHSLAVQACHTAGLDPFLGFYHQPAIGRESLASDLIDPLRPAVDRWVWDLLRQQILVGDHFSTSRGACLMGKAGRSLYYRAWADAHGAWQRWLRVRAMTLARQLRQDVQLQLPDDEEPQ